jgi:hypothetical protein
MLLASHYYTFTDVAFAFICGFVSALLLLYLVEKFFDWKEQVSEFTAWKKRKHQTQEVVDAQFVVSKPRSRNSPQLNSSTALVKQNTGIERGQR